MMIFTVGILFFLADRLYHMICHGCSWAVQTGLLRHSVASHVDCILRFML